MAFSDELSNSLKKLNIKHNHQDILSDIKNNYESIFSWDIHEKTQYCRNEFTDILKIVKEKLELNLENQKIFNFDRMCLHLISCFEIYSNSEYSKALSDINDLIQILKCHKMDSFFKPIEFACFHIVYSTQAYLMVFLNKNVEQILKNIKPFSTFNREEKAAVCAIKSRVFMEYPPVGNKIALELAESARNFNDTELYWISIWLKAKGRKRRFDQKLTFPFRDELEAANKLSSCVNKPELLLHASNVFKEAGFTLKISKTHRNNVKEFNKYCELSNILTLKVYTLADNDLKLLYKCLIILIELPKYLIRDNMEIIEDIVYKLRKVQNNKIDQILGKYFMKIAKDYKIAKTYFERASVGSFLSSLQLLKVECLLNSVENVPIIQYLNTLYDKYNSPKRRLIIISQVLLYYIYIKKNPEKLLHYLNVYLNEDIDYIQKKHHIEATFPLFHLNIKFERINFLKVLMKEIENLKIYQNWNSENKITLENVIVKFSATCNPVRTEENIEISLTCVVCLEIDVAHIVLQPCHHRCVCKTCWNTLKIDQNKCPICRMVVHSILIC